MMGCMFYICCSHTHITMFYGSFLIFLPFNPYVTGMHNMLYAASFAR